MIIEKKCKIFITGGAGYIGAVTAKYLFDLGYEVLVYDHFKSHSPEKLKGISCQKGDILDKQTLLTTLSNYQPDVVMHFAAYIQMGESVKDPQKYYTNNFLGTLSLVEAMMAVGCQKLVFASTAGVYGNVHPSIANCIPESAAGYPTNPYGETKLATERLLKWYDQAYNLRSISIRFFNAAGAYGDLGEDHQAESHIIPNIIKAIKDKKPFTLFGKDYNTPDGTCIRDYIHVLDLAEAFRLAAAKLLVDPKTAFYNAGTGQGYSNKQIIEAIQKISGQNLNVIYAPRRPGDADILVADSTLLRLDLGWSPTHSTLENIIQDAYTWHTRS